MAAEVASQPASYSSVVCNKREETMEMPLNISLDDSSKENVQPPAEQNDAAETATGTDTTGDENKQSGGQQKQFIPAPPPKYNVWKQRMEVNPQDPGKDPSLPKANASQNTTIPKGKANTGNAHKQRTAGGGTPKASKAPQARNRVDSGRRNRHNRREGDHGRKTEATSPRGKTNVSEPLREQRSEKANARKIEAAPPPKVNVWKKPVASTEQVVQTTESVGEIQKPEPISVEQRVVPEAAVGVESVPDAANHVEDPQSWPTLKEVKSTDPESPKQKFSAKVDQPNPVTMAVEDAVAPEEPAEESVSPVPKQERNQRASVPNKKKEKKPKWKPLPLELESSRSRSNRGRNRDQRNHGRVLNEQDSSAKDRKVGGVPEEKNPVNATEGRTFHPQRQGFRGRGRGRGRGGGRGRGRGGFSNSMFYWNDGEEQGNSQHQQYYETETPFFTTPQLNNIIYDNTIYKPPAMAPMMFTPDEPTLRD